MKPVTAGIFLFIVIVLCGYVVSSSAGVYKITGSSLIKMFARMRLNADQ